MAQLPSVFDSSNYEEMNSNFAPIPKGDYLAMVTDSEICDTKSGTGKYIKLEFTLIGGEYKERKIWTNLNIINQNKVTVDMANRELTTLCKAVGKPRIQDTQELHGIPFTLGVKIKPAQGIYEASNCPSGYKKVSGSESVVGQVKKVPAFAKKTEVQNEVEVQTEVETKPNENSGGIPWSKK